MLVYAIDIGGSSVKHGFVEVEMGQARLVEALPTISLSSVEFAELEAVVLNALDAAIRGSPSLQTIGISTTGSVDASGIVVSAGFFKGYRNVSWSHVIKSRFQQIERVATINDGRAAAWAEYSVDPPSVKAHIHVVVGTGVGGGVIYKGELILGDSGQAGYIGHIKITREPTPKCSCGSVGCVETLAAAPAIVRYFNKQSRSSIVEPGPRALDLIVKEAQAGNQTAISAFARAGHWLGLALGNAMNVLNPSVVSVGGGVLLASESIRSEGDGGPFLRAVSEGITEAAHRRVSGSAQLRPARFGNDGGLIGAALISATSSH